MCQPRLTLPNAFYLITRICAQREFLLRPDRETNNNFLYCLIVAAEKYGIDILGSIAESNHHHTVIFDRHGNVSLFMHHFHRLLARCQNVLRGRCENLWAAEEPCVTRLLEPETVVAKLVYAAANPVKDHLVSRAVQWPGVNTYRQLKAGRPLRARRPRFYFAADGDMPAEVSRPLTIPAELGPRDQVIAAVVAGVEEVERVAHAQLGKAGDRAIGRRGILRQSWKARPSSPRPVRHLRPRFAGREAVRRLALAGYRDFLAAYRAARRAWLAGIDVIFPAGTYQLARFAPIRVAPLISTG